MGLGNNQLGAAEKGALADSHAGAVWFTELSKSPVGDVATTSAAAQALAGGIPLLVAANQEGGQIDQFSGPGFSPIPSALQQGMLAPADLRSQAAGWGRELKRVGVNLEVAPVLDTVPPGSDAQNQPIGALEREYGHDPATVTAHGVAFLQGMQGAGEAVTVKHFPGLGRVQGNTDFTGDVVDTQTTPDDPYLLPFQAAVEAGADLVMVSLATYTRIDSGHQAVFSPTVMQLLRGKLGFTGVIVSDDLGAAAAVAGVQPGARAVDFVAAGGDLVTVKYAQLVPQMAQALLERAASDSAFHGRLRESALRVLRLKEHLGLLRC